MKRSYRHDYKLKEETGDYWLFECAKCGDLEKKVKREEWRGLFSWQIAKLILTGRHDYKYE